MLPPFLLNLILVKVREQIPITRLEHPLLSSKGIVLDVLREDLNHPIVQGNKWRKLKYNIIEAQSKNYKAIVSMGGAYSNHLHALAGLGQDLGLKTIAYVREGNEVENPTLDYLRNCGMELHFISRGAYRELRTLEGFKSLRDKHSNCLILPEGGNNQAALTGCKELGVSIPAEYDLVTLSVGTGCTMAGMLLGLKPNSDVMGFVSFKEAHLDKEIESMLSESELSAKVHWNLNRDYHFGGMAKFDTSLIEFVNRFSAEQQVQLEPLYTGKMFFGLFDMIEKDQVENGKKILAIHTGGLQGLAGFNLRNRNCIRLI